MILSISDIEHRSASKHKSEMKFKFVAEVVIEVVVEVSCCLSSST